MTQTGRHRTTPNRKRQQQRGETDRRTNDLSFILSLFLFLVCVDDLSMSDAGTVASQQQFYSQDSMDTGVDHHEEDEEDALTKNDAWHVINSYFDEKGLVRQQLDR